MNHKKPWLELIEEFNLKAIINPDISFFNLLVYKLELGYTKTYK